MAHDIAPNEDQTIALPIEFELLWNANSEIDESEFYYVHHTLKNTGSFKHLTVDIESVFKNETTSFLNILDRGNRRYKHGICFLHFPDHTDKKTAEIGIALVPSSRGKGYGHAAIHKLLAHAFEALRVHRVVASILCPLLSFQLPQEKRKTISDTKNLCHYFEKCGFHFEGVSRKTVLSKSPNGSEWQDVHRLSILDTDWTSVQIASSFVPAVPSLYTPVNPWDKMEQRHEAERKEMLEWCELPVEPGSEENHTNSDEDTYYGGGESSDEDVIDDD